MEGWHHKSMSDTWKNHCPGVCSEIGLETNWGSACKNRRLQWNWENWEVVEMTNWQKVKNRQRWEKWFVATDNGTMTLVQRKKVILSGMTWTQTWYQALTQLPFISPGYLWALYVETRMMSIPWSPKDSPLQAERLHRTQTIQPLTQSRWVNGNTGPEELSNTIYSI